MRLCGSATVAKEKVHFCLLLSFTVHSGLPVYACLSVLLVEVEDGLTLVGQVVTFRFRYSDAFQCSKNQQIGFTTHTLC